MIYPTLPGGAKSTTTCITSLRTLRAKIILADFNLVVSTQTDKPPNLVPHQIFWLYGKLLPDHHKLVGGALEMI